LRCHPRTLYSVLVGQTMPYKSATSVAGGTAPPAMSRA
jgi:hypothetical protein